MPRKSPPAVGVARRGLLLDGKPLPLIAGSMHYFRLDPGDWEPGLRSLRQLGFRLVDVYVPWSVHEIDKDRFDFGHQDPRKDLASFLTLAEAQDLFAIVRPGPHINAEMTLFGLPERIVWRRGCQARSPHGAPVFLPALPQGFPVPSYASKTFFKQASRFFQVVAELLEPLQYPNGPVVMVQVDNEGALYFRDGIYDQDYHPDALALYRRFLAKRYGPKAAPRSVYGRGGGSFHAIEPPKAFDAKSLHDLAWHLDWAAFQEHLVTRFFRRTGKRLRKAGLRRVPTSHNIPMADRTTVLGQGSVQHAVDVVGLDYYYLASPESRRTIARRTSELAIRGDAHDLPSFAGELGAGFPPFMVPMQLGDNAFTVLTAMAYGLRGYNAYMAVERDRWVGAPIDPKGTPRPTASFWARLHEAIHEADLTSLRRKVPVRIVTPRLAVRLERVLHAFGPVSGAAFAVMGMPASAYCRDDDFGTGQPLAATTERFVDAVESVLEAEGIPFAHVGDDDPEACVFEASWVVVAAPAGGVDPALLAALADFAARGGRVTFGPEAPSRDATLRPLKEPPRLPFTTLSADRADVEQTVREATEDLALPRSRAQPASVFCTELEDSSGHVRLLFAIQPETEAVEASIPRPGAGRARDLLTGDPIPWHDGTLTVALAGKTVRVIALEEEG